MPIRPAFNWSQFDPVASEPTLELTEQLHRALQEVRSRYEYAREMTEVVGSGRGVDAFADYLEYYSAPAPRQEAVGGRGFRNLVAGDSDTAAAARPIARRTPTVAPDRDPVGASFLGTEEHEKFARGLAPVGGFKAFVHRTSNIGFKKR